MRSGSHRSYMAVWGRAASAAIRSAGLEPIRHGGPELMLRASVGAGGYSSSASSRAAAASPWRIRTISITRSLLIGPAS